MLQSQIIQQWLNDGLPVKMLNRPLAFPLSGKYLVSPLVKVLGAFTTIRCAGHKAA